MYPFVNYYCLFRFFGPTERGAVGTHSFYSLLFSVYNYLKMMNDDQID